MITCSWGESVLKPDQIYDFKLKDVLDYMTYSDKLWLDCLDIREATKKGDEETKKKLKKSLPYMISCFLKKPKRASKNLKTCNLMILDVDKITDEKKNFLKEELKKEPFTHFFFESPSGTGLKIGMTFNELIIEPELFSYNYKLYADQFGKVYGVEIDNTHDVARACFLSFDEDLYYNPESLPLKVLHLKPVSKKVYKIDKSQDKTVEKARQLCEKCNLILSYDDWYKCAAALADLGHIGEDLFVSLSTGNGSKDSIESIRRKYRACERIEAINIGSFFEIMKKNGVNL